jgi:glutathione S-transferase
MLKIWGRVNSFNVQKVLWCCGELGIPYQRIDAGLQFGVNHTPEYRAMNPNELIPTIADDGLVLWESNAIVRYLARKHAPGSLCPSDAGACADADRWMDWVATTVWPDLRPAFLNLIRIAPDQRDAGAVAKSRDRFSADMSILDAQLAGRDYVTGARFTMGDIPIGIAVHRWFNIPIAREPYPHLERYYHLLRRRPAFNQHVELPLS